MTTQKKIALVTGANRGIGFETARELGQKGIHVIVGARDAAKGQAAVQQLADLGVEADSIALEVNNRADHAKAYDYIEKKYGRLDILVNNAGVSLGEGNYTSRVAENLLRDTFDSNFFGVVALTQKLLPLIRKSEAGRIVNLSSILGSLALHSDPKSPIAGSKAFAYNASKTALNAFTVHLAQELRDTNIKVNSAHPGWVKTDMGGAEAPLEVSEGGKTSVRLATLPADGPTGGYFHLGDTLPW